MDFSFDIQNTGAARASKAYSFWLVKYAGLFSGIFLILLLGALAINSVYFFSGTQNTLLLKASALLFAISLLLAEIQLFFSSKIRHFSPRVKLSEALLHQKEHNIAECLNLNAFEIVDYAVLLCREKNLLYVTSDALLYAGATKNLDIKILLLRLGISLPNLLEDVGGRLASTKEESSGFFSESFANIILEAGVIANGKGKWLIGEKELFLALAKQNSYLQKAIRDQDLHLNDVETITFWLEALEKRISEERHFWDRDNLKKIDSLAKSWTAGFTITFDRFSIDWTLRAERNIFDDVIGRKHEVDALETVLAKATFSNALIIGNPGSGRKRVVQALAKRCFLEKSLPELNGKRIVELDMVGLLSQAKGSEWMEKVLNQIFSEVYQAGNIILVIDGFENFVEQKTWRPGAIDISGVLSKYLALPSFQLIAITSFDALHRKLEQNPSLLEYFRKIEVEEVSEEETVQILQGIALRLEHQYQLLITYPTLKEVVQLTGRYFHTTPFPKKAIDILEEVAVRVKALKERVVLPSHVAMIVSENTQIPLGKVEFKEKEVLLNLEDLIHKRIVNQSEAVKEIAIAMRRARAGIASKKRPMGTFLFLGLTGVGKTETAKALAQIYFGGEEKMIRLDMSEFQSVEDIPRLLGASGLSEQPGLLTTPVREKPFSLVLLDEIEKANKNILNLFLQVFDEGHITDGQGRKVIFTNTIIICTSNAGATALFQGVERGSSVTKDDLLDSLFEKGIFTPEFINRFDAAVVFQPLTKGHLLDIAQLILGSLQKNLRDKDIEFTITEELKEKIVELSYKPQFGAREMRRIVQDKIENEVARALLADILVKGDIFSVDPETFEIKKQ